jgi:hypothetical protein
MVTTLLPYSQQSSGIGSESGAGGRGEMASEHSTHAWLADPFSCEAGKESE